MKTFLQSFYILALSFCIYTPEGLKLMCVSTLQACLALASPDNICIVR